jgi:hypothetical protein
VVRDVKRPPAFPRNATRAPDKPPDPGSAADTSYPAEASARSWPVLARFRLAPHSDLDEQRGSPPAGAWLLQSAIAEVSPEETAGLSWPRMPHLTFAIPRLRPVFAQPSPCGRSRPMARLSPVGRRWCVIRPPEIATPQLAPRFARRPTSENHACPLPCLKRCRGIQGTLTNPTPAL